jgi:predicted cobalt transporter CbtA
MIRWSRAGLWCAGIYLIVTAPLLYGAMTCNDGLGCGLYALPTIVPAALVFGPILDRVGIPSPPIQQWQFVVPVVSTNAAFYYCIGWGVAALVGRVRRFFKRQHGHPSGR